MLEWRLLLCMCRVKMGSLLISYASIRVRTIAVIQVNLERLLYGDCLNKETLRDCVV